MMQEKPRVFLHQINFSVTEWWDWILNAYVHSPLPIRDYVVMNHAHFTKERGKNNDTHSIPLPQSSKDVEWDDIATVLLSPARLEIWIIIPTDESFKFNHMNENNPAVCTFMNYPWLFLDE